MLPPARRRRSSENVRPVTRNVRRRRRRRRRLCKCRRSTWRHHGRRRQQQRVSALMASRPVPSSSPVDKKERLGSCSECRWIRESRRYSHRERLPTSGRKASSTTMVGAAAS
jgi:hypothetical protein